MEDNRFTFAHPSTQQNLLMWATRPRTVLVLKKKGDALLPELVQAVSFLQHEGMCIMLERDVHETLVRRRGNGSSNTGDGRLGFVLLRRHSPRSRDLVPEIRAPRSQAVMPEFRSASCGSTSQKPRNRH